VHFRRYVIANDLSASAVEAMKRNVALNKLDALDENPLKADEGAVATTTTEKSDRRDAPLPKVRINEGDAWCASPSAISMFEFVGLTSMGIFSTLMHSHHAENNRVDVVDLDPYGTAAPFIDAAIQCVKDGGQFRRSRTLKGP
jgi:tRNA (guanine26-N2/guanine27-N2)-dimethyltransferase